jgi:hypothetical protein
VAEATNFEQSDPRKFAISAQTAKEALLISGNKFQ